MLGRCWSGVAVDERGGELYCGEGTNSVPEFADVDNLRRRRTIAPRSWIVYERAKLNIGFRGFTFFKRYLSGSGITS
jgi:hypothetical protein